MSIMLLASYIKPYKLQLVSEASPPITSHPLCTCTVWSPTTLQSNQNCTEMAVCIYVCARVLCSKLAFLGNDSLSSVVFWTLAVTDVDSIHMVCQCRLSILTPVPYYTGSLGSTHPWSGCGYTLEWSWRLSVKKTEWVPFMFQHVEICEPETTVPLWCMRIPQHMSTTTIATMRIAATLPPMMFKSLKEQVWRDVVMSILLSFTERWDSYI